VTERIRFRDLYEARETLSAAELRFERRRRTLGLFAGPLAFALWLAFSPTELPPPASRLAAILLWVLVWWVTEAVPLPLTALVGPALAVLCGVGTAKDLFAPFGDPIIFLFLGSFVLAEAMLVSGLDRRFAYAVLAQRWVGGSTSRILVAFAVVTAGMSMWLSNTATTAMMYPIAMSLLAALARLLGPGPDGAERDLTRLRFGTALMLITAWASSIGGVGTPVGTPPNLIALGQLASLVGIRVPFFTWMLVAIPIMGVMLTLLVMYLRWALPPELDRIEGSAASIAEARTALGRMSRAERNVLVAFGLTVTFWVLPGVLALALGTDAPVYRAVQELLPESVVALTGAALLFVLPVDWKARQFTVSWSAVQRIDWGTLMLFGGGLALSGAMFRTGLAEAVGNGLVAMTGAQSLTALTFLFAIAAVVITEMTSNTATAAMLAPLAIAAAQAAGVDPVPVAMAVAISSSMAFMLPVSTASNAIVYGSGCVPILSMLRYGTVLDLASALLVPGGVLILWRLVS